MHVQKPLATAIKGDDCTPSLFVLALLNESNYVHTHKYA